MEQLFSVNHHVSLYLLFRLALVNIHNFYTSLLTFPFSEPFLWRTTLVFLWWTFLVLELNKEYQEPPFQLLDQHSLVWQQTRWSKTTRSSAREVSPCPRCPPSSPPWPQWWVGRDLLDPWQQLSDCPSMTMSVRSGSSSCDGGTSILVTSSPCVSTHCHCLNFISTAAWSACRIFQGHWYETLK